MPEQFKNIESFRNYQKQIYDYINQEIIQIPYFFENQPKLNDTTIPSNVMLKGGVAQKTIREGSLQFNRKINESVISFKDVYSENKNDLNIIQFIANKLNGEAPSPQNLILDAYIWTGAETIEDFKGPIVNNPIYYQPFDAPYIYLPFVGFVGRDEKLLLRNDSIYLDNQLTTFKTETSGFENLQLENLKNLLKQLGFNFNIPEYNLTDNTGVFLPVGVKKRIVSKKLLRQNSETEITEIVPETLQSKIDNFFRLWTKSKAFIPQGQEYIIGNTMLNNGDFGGAIGPGNSRYLAGQNAQAGWRKHSTGNFNNLVNQFSQTAQTNGQGLFPAWVISENNYEDLNRDSQRISEIENPGFSPFVFSSTRSTPAWYDIQVLSDELEPGVSYTLSLWQAEDNDFNPNNFLEQQLGNTFFYAVTIVDRATNGQQTEKAAVNWAGHNNYPFSGGESEFLDYASPEEYVSAIRGEEVENFQTSDLLWVRYKKTITLPTDDDGKLVSLDGTAYSTSDYKYKLYWYLGYQNSVADVLENSQFYTAGFRLFPGPNIRANSNKARQYYCGLRLNRGTKISSVNSIELTTPTSKSIARILHDCVNILDPYDFDIPIYSKNKVDQLVLSQQASSAIIQLLTEIKEGLINSITSLTAGISETYETLATNIANLDEQTDANTISELGNIIDEFNTMFNNTGIANRIDQLNTNLTNKFNLLTANTIAQPLQQISITPTIQQLAGDFGSRPGFAGNSVVFETQEIAFEGNELDNYYEESVRDYEPVWSTYGTKFNFAGIDSGILIGGGQVGGQSSINYEEEARKTLVNYSTFGINALPSFLSSQNERNNTPIGAMYASEMYRSDSTEGEEFREGNPADNNGYPAVSYGPYAQRNGYDYGYGTDGLARAKGIHEAYFNSYQFNEPNLVSADTTQTFATMNGTNGVVNSNFEPLRVYAYKCTSGLDFAAWIYAHYYAVTTNAATLWNSAGGQYPGYPFPSGDNPKGARGMGLFNMYQYEGNQPNQFRKFDGERTFLLYEPHWEWNSEYNEWVYRFAQPVIGTNSTLNYTDEDLSLNPSTSGEIKYKFKKMHFRKAI